MLILPKPSKSSTPPQSNSFIRANYQVIRALIGFVLSLTPLSCDLMGWRGAGGTGAASTGISLFNYKF